MSEGEQTEGGRGDVWLEKYRPEQFDEIVGQEAIVDRLRSYIDRNDLPNMLFAGPAGVGKCVTGETPVLTNDGVAPVERVVDARDGFRRNDTDLEVLTYTESGDFEYTNPSYVFSKQAERLVAVQTRDGNELTVTPEHRLLVVTHDGLEWREAENMQQGDRIVRPLEAPLPETDRTLDWFEEMDGKRIFVHLTEEFSREHQIPFEENLVGVKKQAVNGLRKGDSVDDIAADVGTTAKTVQAAKREFADQDLDAPSTICSLDYLRELDISAEAIREAVERIQYVSTNNKRSRSITPPGELTPELAEFVGLAISEARIDGGKIKFFNTDRELRARFEQLLSELFGIEYRTGIKKDVPYVSVTSRTLTHYLESCFDVFAGPRADDGIGSAMLEADERSREAFLQAVFDAEGHVTKNGIVELTQKDGDIITVLSYLLAGFGIPSRRKTEKRQATNGRNISREYQTLYISSARHLEQFQSKVGFSIEEKARRLSDAVERDSNPNNDTIPTQSAVTALCEQLNLKKTAYIPDTLNPDSPGRERYQDGISKLLDDATERLEAVQERRERLARLSPEISDITAVPVTWADERSELEPIETRRAVSARTSLRTDRLLTYARGDRTPYTNCLQSILSEMDGAETAPIETVQTELRELVDRLGISYGQIAEETSLYSCDVNNLLNREDHEVGSLYRFRTVTDRLERILSQMASTETLEHLRTLHQIVESDIYLDEVERTETITGSQRVYDLTVPETRNYVAGTVPTVMHNTTSSIAIARELYGEDWEEHFLELNASDERGIDVVRDRIKSFARTSFGGANYRIIFLDEADALCVPPGTEVVTGYPSSPEVKPIEAVDTDGEPIPSVDFETNEIQSDKGKLVDSGVADFFEVELNDGRTILASLSHPFFVVGEDGRLVEKELQDLSPGDEIADFRDNVGLPGQKQGKRSVPGPAPVSDGGLQHVQTAELRRIEYSHRGTAYNISMEGTPNFMLGNGILTHNTSDAQSALRRTMEQFSNNVRFILSCNYSSQIIDPIQSRCTVFRFSPLSDEAIETQVREIADREGIEITDDGVEALIYVAGGDMRAAINGLQAAAVTGDVVDEEGVFEITSTARPEDIREMVTLALAGDFTASRSQLDRLLTDEGIAGGDVIDQLHRSVWEFDLDDQAAVRLLDRIGEADYRITAGANERIQLEALLASLALEK